MTPQQIVSRFESLNRNQDLITREELSLYLQARQVLLLEELTRKLTPFHERKKVIKNDAPILQRDIQDLELSVRATNALKLDSISTVKDLVQRSVKEVKNVPNLGSRSLVEIQDVLHYYGLSLGMEVESE